MEVGWITRGYWHEQLGVGRYLGSLRDFRVGNCREEGAPWIYILCYFGLFNAVGWSYRGDHREA